MSVKEQFVAEDLDVGRRDHDGYVEFVADLGPGEEAAVDIVEETVIVVADGDQYEIEVEGDAQAFMKNGVVTIEVRE